MFKKGSAKASEIIAAGSNEEELVSDRKKHANDATKGKVKAAGKKAAEKIILDIAEKLPAGQAKEFLTITKTIQELRAKKKVIATAERGERAKLKAMKVHLRCFDHVFKMLDWEKEDISSFEVHVALYKEQLGLELSEGQKNALTGLKAKHEATKKAVLEANGGDTGKEIGSTVPSRSDITPESLADTTTSSVAH